MSASYPLIIQGNIPHRVRHHTAIGSEAVFVPANIFAPVPQPAGKDQCALGKAKPAWRETCRGFQPSWTEEDCLRHDCCYDPTPECAAPPPEGRGACGSGPRARQQHECIEVAARDVKFRCAQDDC